MKNVLCAFFEKNPGRRVAIWLDDVREAPEGYIHCKSVNEAKETVIEC